MQSSKLSAIVLTFALFLLMVRPAILAQTPFTKGVNVTNWFQASNIRQVQFTKYTKKDFINIKSLGCDVIRLPIDLTAMTNGSPNYVVDPMLYFMLDSAVTWAEDLQIHLILDNHTMDPASNTDPNIGTMLQKIWIQIAEHYKDRTRYIYYELRNEPHGISTASWATIETNLINAIRVVDTTHTIIVGASSWNTYSELSKLPVFADTNLIYTFHFYDPFLFTHQGATWTSPSMGPLANVPFPYDITKMPACPTALKGTWIEGSLNTSYKTDGTIAKVKQLIDMAVTFKNTRKVNVFCGEFGVYDLNSDPAERVFWYETVRNYMEEKGIPWTIWDYHGGFGLFQKGSDGLFESDLNIPMVNALGLTAPVQVPHSQKIDSSEFFIYNDVVQANILGSASVSSGIVDFYSTNNVFADKYSIEFSGVNQYNNVGFDFKPNRDFTFIKDEGYFLEFRVMGSDPAIKFDIRFIDTKTGTDDHPWRMRKTIDNALVPFDGEWHYVELPLSTFTEHGSWDNAWFGPIGAFDWSAIDRLEFVAEEFALTDFSLWFDLIAISKTGITTGISNPDIAPEKNSLRVWPNPISDQSILYFDLEKAGQIDISVFSVSGQKIFSLSKQFRNGGSHNLPLNLRGNAGIPLTNGIYLCRLTSGGNTQTIKLMLN